MKVGVIVPSYKDSDGKWKTILKKFFEGLTHLKNHDEYEFLFNFQNYSSDDEIFIKSTYLTQIEKINPHWTYKAQFVAPYDDISMVRVRNDAMMLNRHLPLYVSIDDDVYFHSGSGEHYKEIIDLFESDPSVGMIMSAGFLGGYNYKHVPKFSVGKHWMTNRGQFVRNQYAPNSPVFSDVTLEYHRGGYEDMLLALETLARGYKLGTYFNNPAYHKISKMEGSSESTNFKGKSESRYEDDQIHRTDTTFESLNRIMKDRFLLDTDIQSINDFAKIQSSIHSLSAAGSYNEESTDNA